MFKFFIFALILALASAFSPMKALASRNMALNDFKLNTDPTKKSPDGRCLAKDLDVKGRCPGDSGYKPPVGNAPKNFAEYQAALKAAKAAKK